MFVTDRVNEPALFIFIGVWKRELKESREGRDGYSASSVGNVWNVFKDLSLQSLHCATRNVSRLQP